MKWSEEQLGAAAADLYERAAAMLRKGDRLAALTVGGCAHHVANGQPECERVYRIGVAWSLGRDASESADTCSAAVAAISAGKHPPDSLPGRLTQVYQDADAGHYDRDLVAHQETGKPLGRMNAIAATLEWIGAKR